MADLFINIYFTLYPLKASTGCKRNTFNAGNKQEMSAVKKTIKNTFRILSVGNSG
jgi:hypothetical protein